MTVDLFGQINNAVLDLQSAELQSFDRPLKALARLLKHPDLETTNKHLVDGLDLDTFLKSQEGRGNAGYGRLNWPEDPQEVLGYSLLLIERFASNPEFMADFGHIYFHPGPKIMGSINAVTSQIIIPFARDYRAYIASGRDSEVRLTMVTNKRVFIVHGHDSGARETVARFLQSLELDPVILLDQPNSGQTIIEKFEAHASTVSFAVILLTPDDLGGAVGLDPTERARQNVIYELGYFTGKLGRGRVCLLRKSRVDIPSDLAGLVYTELDTEDGWKIKLLRELRAAGFQIDANKVFR